MQKEQLNIAMLGHKYIPSREGGIEVVVEELATRMAACGHLVTCYNRRGHFLSEETSSIGENGIYKGVRLKTVFTIGNKGFSAVSSSFFAAIKSAVGKYDVVHFHAEGPCLFIWIPKMFRKKCIATIHGLDWKRETWKGFGAKVIKRGEKAAVRWADEIIVLSRTEQQYFKNTYGRDTVLIPNGVNRPDIVDANEIVKRFGLHKGEFILYLGRLDPDKGLEYLIEAYRVVDSDKKLIIAGGSSRERDYLEQLKRVADGDDRVKFIGFVNGEILSELYSNAYIYCLPSNVEGMPLSLLEAMSFGNCCLVSDVAEIMEIVEDQAVTFRKGDARDLAEKFRILCENPELVSRYKTGTADFVCRKYNWEVTVARTLELYSS